MNKISEFDSETVNYTTEFIHGNEQAEEKEPVLREEQKVLNVSERKAELQRFAELFASSSEQAGVFEVEYADFEMVLELASRFTKRNEQDVQLVMFTLLRIDEEFKDEAAMEKISAILAGAISGSLRRVDICVKLNIKQYLVALIDAKEEHISVVTDRIVQRFYSEYMGGEYVLDYDIAKANR